MPQASPQTRRLFHRHFEDQLDGERYLRDQGYDVTNGYITYPKLHHKEKKLETIVLNYLCDEWDYAVYEPLPQKE